jgi:hypothetical protein
VQPRSLQVLICFTAALLHVCLPLQGYRAGTVVLAQQLLLALSPLHAQLLPRPETAFLCPSSFNAAVGKQLMSEMASRPVLDLFRHNQAQLSMWHIWWHIGLRRYAAQQQQQGTCSNVDALYLDPDAK